MKATIIGLGSFGTNVAQTLYERGHEVLAIDKSKERIEWAKDITSHAVHADSTEKKNLEALGVREMDAVVVSLGHELEASVLTVLYLRELGVKRIIAKALNEDHGKILSAVGATEVVYPEKEMAIRTALRLVSPNVLDSLSLISGVSIQEIAPPERFIGRSLRDLDLRNRFGIQVLAVRELVPERMVFVPLADFIIKDSDILIVMGEEKSLEKINSY